MAPFSIIVSAWLHFGKDNQLAIRLNSFEQASSIADKWLGRSAAAALLSWAQSFHALMLCIGGLNLINSWQKQISSNDDDERKN